MRPHQTIDCFVSELVDLPGDSGKGSRRASIMKIGGDRGGPSRHALAMHHETRLETHHDVVELVTGDAATAESIEFIVDALDGSRHPVGRGPRSDGAQASRGTSQIAGMDVVAETLLLPDMIEETG